MQNHVSKMAKNFAQAKILKLCNYLEMIFQGLVMVYKSCDSVYYYDNLANLFVFSSCYLVNKLESQYHRTI